MKQSKPVSVIMALGALLGTLGGLLTVSPALASVPTGASRGWSVTPSPNPVIPTGQLSWVSCPAPSSCMAVGTYTKASGAGVTLAEQWNGNQWRIQPVPSPPSPPGAAGSGLSGVSCVSMSACEAVGVTVSRSGAQTALAEGWNGSRWQLQHAPTPAGGRQLIGVSCTSPSACTAVGASPPGTPGKVVVERWDGSSWRIQSAPSPAGAVLFGVACTSSSACTAVGGSAAGTLAERWDGTTWRIQATANPPQGGGALGSVACTSPSACTAVGNSNAGNLAERWNGSSWAIQRTPNPAGAQFTFLNTVACASASACTAAGTSFNSSGAFQPVAERWDGSTWAIQPTPRLPGGAMSQLIGVACTSATGCVAVGFSILPGENQAPATLAERWNGSTWKVQAAPGPPGAGASNLFGVACTAPSACVAVGSTTNSRGVSQTLAQRWNGRTWRLQKIPSRPGASLNWVTCASASACEAVGVTTSRSGAQKTLAERWNGTRWSIQATPNPAGAQASGFTAVSCASASSCVAVGGSNPTGTGKLFVLAERWNGHAWRLVPAPTPSSPPNSLFIGVACPAPAACIGVGASSDSSGNNAGTFAERWDGSRWTVQRTPTQHTPGGGLNGVWCQSVTACIAVGGTNAGTLAERLTGTTWTVQSTPNPPGTQGDFLNSVSCTSLSACTGFGIACPYPVCLSHQILAERWNGTRWRIQPTPTPFPAFRLDSNAVACPTVTTCIAVGAYTNNLTQVTLAERWNGAGQSALLPANRSAPPGGLRSACLRASPLQPRSFWGRTPESARRWPQAAILPTPASAGQPTRPGWCPPI